MMMNPICRQLRQSFVLAACLAGLLAWNRALLAEPAINSVSGTLIGNSTLTIEGTDFGSQGPGVLSWDNFENHSLGTQVHNSSAMIGPNWTTLDSADPGIYFDDTHVHAGNVAAHVNWTVGGNNHAFGWANRRPLNSLYISYWRYMQGNYSAVLDECHTSDGYNCNHKQFYVFGTVGELPQAMSMIPAGTSTWSFYNNVGVSQGSTSNTKGWNYSNTANVYQRWSFWMKLNEPWDCSENVNCNGEISYWIDGSLGRARNDYRFRFVDGTFDDFRLGYMAQGFTASAKAWFDDLYIATTPARVELCSNSSWAIIEQSGAHCEVQVATSWTPLSVQINFNQGSFSVGNPAYLYLIDAQGQVNASGYLVTIGGPTVTPTVDVVAPNAPANLRTQGG